MAARIFSTTLSALFSTPLSSSSVLCSYSRRCFDKFSFSTETFLLRSSPRFSTTNNLLSQLQDKTSVLSTSQMIKKTNIVIIGAGAAGIAAASRLMEQGIEDFIVLEASDRFGGRINTVSFADNVVDLGAESIHDESENGTYLAFKRMLNPFSILFYPEKHMFFCIDGTMIPKEEGTKILEIYNNIRIPEPVPSNIFEHDNFAIYFLMRFYEIFDKTPFISLTRSGDYVYWLERIQNCIDGSESWLSTSLKRLMNYKFRERFLLQNWKDRSYKTALDILIRGSSNAEECLPVMKKVEFEKVVKSIDTSSDEDIIVTTRDGCCYLTSHVIFSASLGVLQSKGFDMFVPPLPDKKQSVIKTAKFGTVNKVFLEFSHKWWPNDIAAFNILWTYYQQYLFLDKYEEIFNKYKWIFDISSFYTVDNHPNVLCAWLAGENAILMESISDDEVINGFCFVLKQTLGKYYQFVEPQQILRSKWFSNEHFRGSYSFQNTASVIRNFSPKDLAESIMRNGKPIILFAGEATHEHFYGTVHGAIESGFREADRLVDFSRRNL